MTEHESDLMELVGTHGWKALRREADIFLQKHHSTIYSESQDEFNFIRKEVASGVVREFRYFLDGIEQKADEIATRNTD